jgi:hypothetical protein
MSLHPNFNAALHEAIREAALHGMTADETAQVLVTLAHSLIESELGEAMADNFLRRAVARTRFGVTVGRVH